MTITHKIQMDLIRRGIVPRLSAVQGDALTRQVEIELLADGSPWPIPGEPTVLIRYRRPDRATGEYDTLPNGSPAGQTAGSAVTITLSREVLAVPGDVMLVVTLILGGRELSTFEFIITVQPNHSRDIFSGADQASVTGMLPAPDAAKPGQILVIEEVDEYGLIRRMKADDALPGTTITQIALDESMSDETVSRYLITMNDNSVHAFEVNHGKTAYAYAQEAGYSGTEAEFSQNLAHDCHPVHVGEEAPEDETVCLWIDTDEETEADVPSDWDAPEGEAGHVLNRTHYVVWTEIISSTQVELDESGMGMLETDAAMVLGTNYKVMWNGVEYVATAALMDGTPFIGNADIPLGSYDGAGVPFCIGYTEGVWAVFCTDSSTVTVSIQEEVVSPLPEKYLPPAAKTYTVVIPEGEVDTNTSAWTLSEPCDRAAEVLYTGGDVWIDYSAGTTGICRSKVNNFAISRVESGSFLLVSIYAAGKNVSVVFANGTWIPEELKEGAA